MHNPEMPARIHVPGKENYELFIVNPHVCYVCILLEVSLANKLLLRTRKVQLNFELNGIGLIGIFELLILYLWVIWLLNISLPALVAVDW